MCVARNLFSDLHQVRATCIGKFTTFDFIRVISGGGATAAPPLSPKHQPVKDKKFPQTLYRKIEFMNSTAPFYRFDNNGVCTNVDYGNGIIGFYVLNPAFYFTAVMKVRFSTKRINFYNITYYLN